ncbi:hypothetical protein ASD13_06320 [Microbacterium sp. Root1433D1]|uniref:hypothetical protein n=1 Tax=Microbacterium sp. Root1433D1 TaxID=1736463 RepID=UPI0007023516|nr:hypothetical protein [Microbacterium sp. Root1433D1]KQY75851.1 hypothetical protein ASD13_06320 [Microbacterium sp. Root1433D1]
MPTPSNDEFIANLDVTIPDAARTVVMAAKNVATFSAETGDTAVLRAYANLQFFITQVDLDIRMNLRLLLADESSRITAEKYLALALIEAEKGVGIMMRELAVEAGKQHGRLAGFLDPAKWGEAMSAMTSKLKEMRTDKPFYGELILIRNEVVAHFVSKSSGVENSAKWALSRSAAQKTGGSILNSLIVSYSVDLATGLAALSRGMTAASADWMDANLKR